MEKIKPHKFSQRFRPDQPVLVLFKALKQSEETENDI